MRVLFISESPLAKVRDAYFAMDPWIKFPIHLAAHCEQFSLLAPVREYFLNEELSQDHWRLDPGRMTIVHHADYASYIGYYRSLLIEHRKWKRQLLELAHEHDIVLLRLPSPMISLVTEAARRSKKPFALFVAGDVEAQSDRVLRSQGMKRFFYQAVVKYMVWKEVRCSRDASIIYAYSKELAARHRLGTTVRRIRTPHLSLNDIVGRDDTCLHKGEIRLLRVSWLLPSKGLEYLLEAVSKLVNKGYPVYLDIVGKERGDYGYQEQLEARAERLGIRNRVAFQGWMPHDRLAAFFQGSDIQVISSLSEGTPRVILEGAARGLPLVSTTSGGCGDVLRHEHDALLVPPGDAEALARALERVIGNAPLRQRLIQHGYEVARLNSFEYLGMTILKDLQETCRSYERGTR